MKRIVFESIILSLLAVVGLIGFILVIKVLVFSPAPMYDNKDYIGFLFLSVLFGGVASLIAFVTSIVFLSLIKGRARHAFHKKVKSLEDAVFSHHTGEVLQTGEKPSVEKALDELQEWVTKTYPEWKETEKIRKSLFL